MIVYICGKGLVSGSVDPSQEVTLFLQVRGDGRPETDVVEMEGNEWILNIYIFRDRIDRVCQLSQSVQAAITKYQGPGGL